MSAKYNDNNLEDKVIIKENNKKETSVEQAIPVSAIYNLSEIKKYQKDYVRVLLPNKEYKPSEAIKILKDYFKE